MAIRVVFFDRNASNYTLFTDCNQVLSVDGSSLSPNTYPAVCQHHQCGVLDRCYYIAKFIRVRSNWWRNVNI